MVAPHFIVLSRISKEEQTSLFNIVQTMKEMRELEDAASKFESREGFV